MDSSTKPVRSTVTYSFRSLKSIDFVKFRSDVMQSTLYTAPAESADQFAEQIDSVTAAILDLHCRSRDRPTSFGNTIRIYDNTRSNYVHIYYYTKARNINSYIQTNLTLTLQFVLTPRLLTYNSLSDSTVLSHCPWLTSLTVFSLT